MTADTHAKKTHIDQIPRIQYEIDWPQASFLIITPILALWTLFNVPLPLPTLIWSIVYYFMTGMGITAGYHRMWAHKAYDANLPYQIYMALVGAGAVQGSIRWWARGHRAHHRYTDTDKDPYSAHRGLYWSHIGWMLVKPSGNKSQALGRVDMSDLDSAWIVKTQHKYYIPLAFFMSFVFPMLISGMLSGDYYGGLMYAGITRLVVVHHATFCVNSLAHYLGEQTYDDVRTPRDHWFTALMTFGEGNHNYHHEFPNDYRNAIKWHQYDPTKWMIRVCSCLGLTYNLKRFPDNEVQKGALQMLEKKCMSWRHQLDWGIPHKSLPTWDKVRFSEELKLNPFLIIIDDVAHDVSLFINDHPGGQAYLKLYAGKDATIAFNGGVYMHATAARNLMSHLRVARVASDVDFTTIKEE